MHLDRRQSRDGMTRVKLTKALTDVFLDAIFERRLDDELAACAHDLRIVQARMARSDGALDGRDPIGRINRISG